MYILRDALAFLVLCAHDRIEQLILLPVIFPLGPLTFIAPALLDIVAGVTNVPSIFKVPALINAPVRLSVAPANILVVPLAGIFKVPEPVNVEPVVILLILTVGNPLIVFA